MCGIVGIKKFNNQSSKADELRIQNALPSQKHRGPDHTGIELLGNVVLGHNRLAIIDTKERSNQPFKDETGRYAIVFNGEIYNYPELKNDLLKQGYKFQTSSDTEVLLLHLIENGAEGINDLEGCFSFAFYDNEIDELILARDRMGINPLLFSIGEDQITFSSELNSFRWLIDEHHIDKRALANYFKFTYIPAPLTILREVQKLMPGHYLKVTGSDFDIVKYFEEVQIEVPKDYKSASKELRNRVERAVISRLNADVPLGTFLSGGVDSSVVSAIAADFKTELSTFSIGFEDNKFYDESEYAKKVADHIGSHHHAIQLTKQNVLAELPELLNRFDEPFADSSSIAMYFLSSHATKRLTVCLSGDGADELFGGYNKHTAFVKSKSPGFLLSLSSRLAGKTKFNSRSLWLSNRLRQLKKFDLLRSLSWPDNYWFLASFVSEQEFCALLQNSKIELPNYGFDESLSSFLKQDQLFVLPNDMLKKVDLMSMANSLEVRVPFLDAGVVEFANSIPDEWKNDGEISKKILKDAFADLLPEEIFKRSKKGFEVPLTEWVKESWEDVVDKKWFEKSFIEGQDLFRFEGLEALKHEFFSQRPGESAIRVWAYVVFQNWYGRWSEKLK